MRGWSNSPGGKARALHRADQVQSQKPRYGPLNLLGMIAEHSRGKPCMQPGGAPKSKYSKIKNEPHILK